MKPLMVQPIRPEASVITTFLRDQTKAGHGDTFINVLGIKQVNWVRLADSGRKAVQTANRTASSSFLHDFHQWAQVLRSPTRSRLQGHTAQAFLGPKRQPPPSSSRRI